MIRLEILQTDNVLDVIYKIKNIKDLNIEIIIPEESIVFENFLNLKLIQQQADKMEKSVEFVTEDEFGNNLISSLMGKSMESFIPEEFEQDQLSETHARRDSFFKKVHLPKIKVPSFVSSKKGLLIPIIITLTALGGFIYYGSTAPKATATIKIRSQPLTRSVTIKVVAETDTDVENKVLKGTVLTTNVEETSEIATTGTKTIGEKAGGKIKIYNNTTSEIKLEKGDKVVYEGKSTDLRYLLKDDVEVSASTKSDPLDPASSIIPGEATVKIEAADIGESYNIDDGKALRFLDYEKSELEGKTKEDISGGKSKEVKIVTQEDLTNLTNEVKTRGIQKAQEDIKNKLGITQKLIEGSTETQIISEKVSAKLGDEAEKVSLTQSISAKALVYLERELDNFMDKYVEDVVPENFVLSSKDKTTEVQVLGKSTNSVLSSTEADIQVTLKAFVDPDIREEDVKNRLKGKTYQEAQEIIGSLKNVNSYEFSISPSIPFFKKTPNNIERIDIFLVRE